MNIITVNVGQGSCAIVRNNREAIIVDCRIPAKDDKAVVFVKEMFAIALKDHGVKGFILTGFDDDHCCAVGTAIVLQKYRPDWVLYPKYYKDTAEAKDVFGLIREQESLRKNSPSPLKTIPIRLDQLGNRSLQGLSANFSFELFSPHIEDMDCSNNCSIVLKLNGLGNGGFSYLITGDTEVARWVTIERLFGAALKSHVLAAPHHGSINAVHPASLLRIEPHTILISAGVNNQYGHPSAAAVKVYDRVAKVVWSTNMNGGGSLLTQPGSAEIVTTFIPSTNAV